MRRLLPSGSVIPAGASNVIVRTELLRRVGGFDEGIYHMPDWDLWLRLHVADRGAAVSEPLVGYVQHTGMLSFRRTLVLDRDLSIIDGKLRAQGLRATDASVRRGLLEWMAEAHVASGAWRRAARTYARSAVAYRRLDDLLLAVGASSGRLGWRAARRLADRLIREQKPSPAPEPPPWLSEYPEFPSRAGVPDRASMR